MNARAWRCEPMLLLVIGLPAAAVVAGIATLFIAMGGSGDAGDARVRRVAQTQTADLAPDRRAAQIALRAEVRLDRNGAVSLRFADKGPSAHVLRFDLRHVTDPRRDRAARLVHAGGGEFLGRLDAPRATGAYNAELTPEDDEWRVIGRLEPADAVFALRPALED